METCNGQVTGGGLNLRASASTSAAILIQIPNGTQIVVSDYSGNTDWYCTTYAGYSGFVMKQYVSILNTVSPIPGTVTGGWLNLRESPSTSAPRLIQIPNNQEISVASHNSEWYATSYGGFSGFVMKAYVNVADDGSYPIVAIVDTDLHGRGGYLNLRKSTDTGSASVAQIPDGAAINVSTLSGEWLPARYQTHTGYVMAIFVAGSDAYNNGSGLPSDWRYGIVIAIPDVNIRNAPSTSGTKILGKWQTNRIGIVTASSAAGWYKTNWKGKTSYVMASFLSDIGEASSSIPMRMTTIADPEVGLAEPDAYTYYGIGVGIEWCQGFINWLALQAGMSTSLVPATYSTPKGIEWHIMHGNRFWFVSEANKAKMREYSTDVSSNTVAGLTDEEKSFVPQIGDFIYFRFKASDHCSHSGFVYSVDVSAGTLITVEGNVSNKVVKRSWELIDGEDRIVGYGRLQY